MPKKPLSRKASMAFIGMVRAPAAAVACSIVPVDTAAVLVSRALILLVPSRETLGRNPGYRPRRQSQMVQSAVSRRGASVVSPLSISAHRYPERRAFSRYGSGIL